MSAKPIIIDCDPGVDDAIALLLALASPELNLLGVTTVAGNIPLSLTQKNARQICELAGRTDVLVYAGCPRPIMRSLSTAQEVHGVNGLAGVELPEPIIPLPTVHGVDFLIETLINSAGDITLATLGPLTNIAVAMIKEPRICNYIREIVIMGGAITQGNITPSAEFNIYVDPHAAHVVLTSGLKLTAITLDVTHQAITTPERLAAIRDLGTPIAKIAANLLEFYGNHDSKRFGMAGGPLHDPCVIAYLLAPNLFQGSDLYVEVETSSELTIGRTVVDLWGTTNRQPNVHVIQTINADGFYQLLTQRLARL